MVWYQNVLLVQRVDEKRIMTGMLEISDAHFWRVITTYLKTMMCTVFGELLMRNASTELLERWRCRMHGSWRTRRYTISVSVGKCSR